MKTLIESLFDIDKNTIQGITFGDVFTFDEVRSQGLHNRIDLELSAQRVKRASKISYSYPIEIIYKGMIKLIQNIHFDVPPEEADRDWLRDKISTLIKDLFRQNVKDKKVYIGLYRLDKLVMVHDESIFNVDVIQIGVSSGLRLVFNKKN